MNASVLGNSLSYFKLLIKRKNYDIISKNVVSRIIRDVKNNGDIALIKYEDGIMNYILAPNKIKVGDQITSGKNKEIKIGNCMPLSDIPAGTDIHNIELTPNGGGKIARSAGSYAQISGIDENYCIIKLGSGEIRKII